VRLRHVRDIRIHAGRVRAIFHIADGGDARVNRAPGLGARTLLQVFVPSAYSPPICCSLYCSAVQPGVGVRPRMRLPEPAEIGVSCPSRAGNAYAQPPPAPKLRRLVHRFVAITLLSAE
jgi:hypothetical protein